MSTITAGVRTAPGLPSDGLTLDTEHGDVDLVAVDRALKGIPTALNAAESAYLIDLIAGRPGIGITIIARGMRRSNDTVKRAITRKLEAQRAGEAQS